MSWLLCVFILCFHPFWVHGGSHQYAYTPGAVPQGGTVGMEEVLEILETYFQRIYSVESYRIEIKNLWMNEKVVLPPGTSSHEIILPERAQRGGNISATILFWVNGKEVKRLKVMARVDIYADVVVAKYALKKHQVIELRDLCLINRNIALLPSDIIFEMSGIPGKRVTLSINAQEVLRSSMVEIPPLIKKGDRVLLLLENHSIRITALGESKEEGRRGDRVKLTNLLSKKEVYGKILDADTVLIDF